MGNVGIKINYISMWIGDKLGNSLESHDPRLKMSPRLHWLQLREADLLLIHVIIPASIRFNKRPRLDAALASNNSLKLALADSQVDSWNKWLFSQAFSGVGYLSSFQHGPETYPKPLTTSVLNKKMLPAFEDARRRVCLRHAGTFVLEDKQYLDKHQDQGMNVVFQVS